MFVFISTNIAAVIVPNASILMIKKMMKIIVIVMMNYNN